MVKDEGLEVVQHYSKPGRICVEAQAPNGVKQTFALTRNNGDVRGDQNERSRIRRFTRENTPIPPAVEIPPPVITPKRSIVKKSDSQEPSSTAAKDLTPIEFYKLCEWLKGINCATLSGIDVLSRAASSALGQEISELTMREAMTATETPEPDAWHPLPDPHVVLARELEGLLKELGHQPSPTLRRLLATMA
jgi:hypothetical protein